MKTGIKHLSFGSTHNKNGHQYQRYSVTLVIDGKPTTKSFGISQGQYSAYNKALDFLEKMGKPIPKNRQQHYFVYDHDKF